MNLEDIAESDMHARWVVANHVGNGTERPRCAICDTWWPCDLIGLAALAVRLREAIDENTFHEVDEYTGKCLPACWRCELGDRLP